MIFYLICHKESGEFMPQMKKGRGYTHWNPSNKTKKVKQQINIPRLIGSLKMARKICALWASMPNASYTGYTSAYGEDDYDIRTRNDGRKIEDLDIIEINIEIVNTFPSKL